MSEISEGMYHSNWPVRRSTMIRRGSMILAALIALHHLPVAAIEHAGSIEDVELVDRWGIDWYPSQLVTDRTKLLVITSMGVRCPLARRMIPTLNTLQQEFQERGVQFIGVFPNARINIVEMATFATEFDIVFPVFRDAQGWGVQQLGLSRTPEVAVLDVTAGYANAQLVYRGAIDDSLGAASRHGTKRARYLEEALQSLLTGDPLTHPRTSAPGCEITTEDFRNREHAGAITYYRDIAPIIQNSCQRCHREGNIGGEYYLFDSYEDVANHHATILRRIEDRTMPPWHANIPDPDTFGRFVGDHRLSEEEIDRFRAWVAQGVPAGNPADAPSPVHWPRESDWRIGGGKPDYVYTMSPPYQVAASERDDYQYRRIDINAPEDKWVRAIQLRPGNASVVHHIAAVISPHSERSTDGLQAVFELYGIVANPLKLGDFVPGDPFNARTYPPDQAVRIPAGHDIIFEIHYAPTGRDEAPDASSLGVVWAEGPPKTEISSKIFSWRKIVIPPHAQHVRLERYFGFEHDVALLAMAPHMHYRGKSFSVYKVTHRGTPAEHRQIVYRVPAYDFDWQRTYEFETPLVLKAGEYLLGVAHYDNSIYNPNNPDPDQLVRWGLGTKDEMFNIRVKYFRLD